MSRKEKIKSFVERQALEINCEINGILIEAEKTEYEDLRLGLLQRATDLAEERKEIMFIIEAIPTGKVSK